jgi:hypothetical protein
MAPVALDRSTSTSATRAPRWRSPSNVLQQRARDSPASICATRAQPRDAPAITVKPDDQRPSQRFSSRRQIPKRDFLVRGEF